MADSSTTDASKTPHILAQAQSALCMAIDGDHLYWINSSGVLVRAAKTGGPLDTAPLADGHECGLAVNGSALFVTLSSGGSINEVDLTASAFGTKNRFPIVGLHSPSSLVVDDTFIYVTEKESSDLRKCRVANPNGNDACEGEYLVSGGLSTPDNIVQDASNVYWINRGDGSVMRASKSGSGAIVVVPPSFDSGEQPKSLTIAGGRLYWTSVFSIRAADVDGSNVVVLANNPHGIYANAIAVDETTAFWGGPDGLHRVSAQGGADKTVWSDPTGLGSMLFVDSTRVYWTDGVGNIWTVLK